MSYGEVHVNAQSDSMDLEDSAHREEADVVPAPEDLMVGEVPVHIEYRESYFLYADIYIDFEAAQQLTRLPAVKVDSLGRRAWATIHLTSPDVEGDVLSTEAWRLDDLFRSIKQYKLQQGRKTRRQEAENKIDQFVRQRDDLAAAGRPVEKLGTLIQSARLSLLRSFDRGGKPYDVVLTALRTVEKEIERIKDGGCQLLVNDLLNGSIFHPHVMANQNTLAVIDVFSIRTGNVLDTEFTEGRLYDFYMDRLEGITHASQLESCDLLISLDDYVVEESELDGFEVAPITIELPSNKGMKSYEVTYAYKDIEGHKQAVATIRMPYKVYDEISYEYGRKSQLPQLPHGILWAFEVTLGDIVLASGLDNKDLRSHVERRKKGIERGGKLTNAEQNSFEATQLPPWAMGVRIHRR